MVIKNLHLERNKKNQQKNAADFMPHDKQSQQILRDRANRLAKVKMDTREENEAISYIRFRLGKNEHYGIPYLSAKEVMHGITLTQLPNTASFIAGLINWRGMLLTILDLQGLFHNQLSDSKSDISVIVVMTNGITVGILADNIEGSDFYSPTGLEAALTADHVIKSDYILGLHNGNTAIINVEKIVLDIKSQLSQ